MSDRKRQHFVPQFYLRNFSINPPSKQVALFHLPTGRYVSHSPIRSEAGADYFYKRIEVEAVLSNIEGVAANLIARAVKAGELPARFSEDHHALLLFVVCQLSRTPAAADEFIGAMNAIIRKVSARSPEMEDRLKELKGELDDLPASLIRIATLNYAMAIDLRWKLLVNKTDLPFITSDHPGVRYNQFLEHRPGMGSRTGLGGRGLQIFFPLSPKCLLVLFDGNVYRIGGKKLRVINVEVAHEPDVNALNLLQVVNADKKLYFDDGVNEAYIRGLVGQASKHLRQARTTTIEHKVIGPHGLPENRLATTRVDVRTRLRLRCVGVLPSAAGSPVSNRVFEPRNPRLFFLYEQFWGDVLAGSYSQTQFGKWLRDHKVLQSQD